MQSKNSVANAQQRRPLGEASQNTKRVPVQNKSSRNPHHQKSMTVQVDSEPKSASISKVDLNRTAKTSFQKSCKQDKENQPQQSLKRSPSRPILKKSTSRKNIQVYERPKSAIGPRRLDGPQGSGSLTSRSPMRDTTPAVNLNQESLCNFDSPTRQSNKSQGGVRNPAVIHEAQRIEAANQKQPPTKLQFSVSPDRKYRLENVVSELAPFFSKLPRRSRKDRKVRQARERASSAMITSSQPKVPTFVNDTFGAKQQQAPQSLRMPPPQDPPKNEDLAIPTQQSPSFQKTLTEIQVQTDKNSVLEVESQTQLQTAMQESQTSVAAVLETQSQTDRMIGDDCETQTEHSVQKDMDQQTDNLVGEDIETQTERSEAEKCESEVQTDKQLDEQKQSAVVQEESKEKPALIEIDRAAFQDKADALLKSFGDKLLDVVKFEEIEPEPPKNACTNYLKGRCKFGNKCKFPHPPLEEPVIRPKFDAQKIEQIRSDSNKLLSQVFDNLTNQNIR